MVRVAGVLALLAPCLVVAQSTRSQTRCNGQRVTDVVIRSEGPSFGASFRRFPAVGALLSGTHAVTRPEVVREYLLLAKGDRCTALRRTESERVLRALPFIAEATVTAYQDGDGVRLEVLTVDEPSLVGNVGVRNADPWIWKATLGNSNLMGRGVYASGQWRDGGFYRDAWAMRYTNYLLWDRPYQLDMRWAQREVGHEVQAAVLNPFLSEVQRVAWRLSSGQGREYARFLRPDTLPAALGVDRAWLDAGVLARFGPSGRRGLVGAQFSVEDATADRAPVEITPRGIVGRSVPELEDRYPSYRSVRLNALLGFRRIRFRRVTGFDALRGAQDLRTGVQVSGTIGKALGPSRGLAEGERYAGGEAYAGIAGDSWFAAAEANVDARHAPGATWEDVLSTGRLAGYVKPHPRHLIMTDIVWSSIRGSRVPVQLSLADRWGGLRGYKDSWLAGASRVIAHVEERWRVADINGTASVALAGFAEAGSTRAGDVPFGTNSGLRSSVGMSLIAALPASSQRLWRVDFSMPTHRGGGAAFEIRMSAEDRTRLFWRTPNDMRGARERTVAQSLFRWP